MFVGIVQYVYKNGKIAKEATWGPIEELDQNFYGQLTALLIDMDINWSRLERENKKKLKEIRLIIKGAGDVYQAEFAREDVIGCTTDLRKTVEMAGFLGVWLGSIHEANYEKEHCMDCGDPIGEPD